MSTPLIIGLSAGGAVLLLIVLIIVIRISNTNRFNKKFKHQMEKLQEEDPNITFEQPKKESTAVSETSNKRKGKAIVEDYVDDDLIPSSPQESEGDSHEELRKKHEDRFAKAMKKFEEISKRNKEEREKHGEIEELEEKKLQAETDDFEEFMNEHSYGRLFADKTLFEQIKDLSPEMKAILFSGIFRPYDENK